ncbi:MAG: DNA cytosine methyltransferase [Sphingomicrobium sp.]
MGVDTIEQWLSGARKVPAGIGQSLLVLSEFSRNGRQAMTKPQQDTDNPGRGKRVLSFFTGCGGLDLGFEQAGFETIYATDIDRDSCETLGLNVGRHFNANMKIERADITALNPRSLPQNIDLVIGGPPCQSFSASGRRAGGAAGRLDQRGRLFEAYCSIIEEVRPKAFLFENVRGILATNKGEDWKAIVEAFGRLGYTISYRLLDALDYGVPQQRERMFLVGHQLDHSFLFPEPTHGPDSRSGFPHVSAAQAFVGIDEAEKTDLLKLVGGKYSHLLPLVPPGQNYLHFTAKRGYSRPIFAYRSRFSDFLYKADPNAPVKTIIASPGKYTGPLHWDNRYFSVREYMRLQGFPDDFSFSGKRADVIRQIGNSVSPRIAHQLALAIAKQVFDAASPVRLLDPDRVLTFDSRKGAKAQKTRAMHTAIVKQTPGITTAPFFAPVAYSSIENAVGTPSRRTKVHASVGARGVSLKVETDSSGEAFAKMVLAVRQSADTDSSPLVLTVTGFGRDPITAQAMWNAVDEWVQRSSNFHSLFELYGHFTEPHPQFSVAQYVPVSLHPIAVFSKHASDFVNCSRYFPRSHLTALFGTVLGTDNFVDIARYLRRHRFDIRSHETNVAIDPAHYMVAYPFTLPNRRQMNFSLRDRADVEQQAA